jgi:hypothetical protein
MIGFFSFYLKEWLVYVDSLLDYMLGVHRDNVHNITFSTEHPSLLLLPSADIHTEPKKDNLGTATKRSIT